MFGICLRRRSIHEAVRPAVVKLIEDMKVLLDADPVKALQKKLREANQAVVCTRFDYRYNPVTHTPGSKEGLSGLGIVLTADGFRVATHSTASGRVKPGDVGEFKLAGFFARRQIEVTLAKVIMEAEPGKMQNIQRAISSKALVDRINSGIRHFAIKTGRPASLLNWTVS